MDALVDVLNSSDRVVLELLAIKPVANLPPLHRSTVGRLLARGLLQRDGECWSPTAAGLVCIGKTVH